MRNPVGSAARTRTDAGQNPSTIQQDHVTTSSGRDQESVARRAYELFEARGGEHGRDQEDWFAAEREFDTHRQDGE
jgi:hypothetical protein